MKMKPITVGILSFFSPVPMFIFTILWYWTWAFGIGMGLLGYDRIPVWILVVGPLPMLISPALGIFGMIYGIRRRKEKLAWLGILLSALCVITNAMMIFGMGYIGSRY